jgi:hypothetical protein
VRIRHLPVLFLVGACWSTASQPEPAEPPAPAAPVAATPAPEVQAWEVLSPSPLQIEHSVRDAGLGDSLADLVPTTLPAMPAQDDKDAVAFRTGVVFTYVLLSGRTADKPVFLAGLRSLRDGMATIGTGQGWLSEMDDAIVQVENDTASRDDFLDELNAMVESSVPEEGWGPTDKTGPLLQAGAWLTGMNLMAQAVVKAGDTAAADKLLRRPDIAEFYLRYIRTEEGASKASMGPAKIAESLEELRGLSSKESLSIDDAKRMVEVTDRLIAML